MRDQPCTSLDFAKKHWATLQMFARRGMINLSETRLLDDRVRQANRIFPSDILISLQEKVFQTQLANQMSQGGVASLGMRKKQRPVQPGRPGLPLRRVRELLTSRMSRCNE